MKFMLIITLFLFTAGAVFSDTDQNPRNNGTTLCRVTTGRHIEAVVHNPALLGMNRVPRAGLTIPGTMLGVGVWSDKLAITPFNKYWVDSAQETSALITSVLNKSFDLEGLTPGEVSERLTDELKDGVSIYTGIKSSLLNFGWENFAFDITTRFDEEVHIPGGPFMMLFSETDGLVPGSTIDLSTFRQEAVWATDFTFSLGLPLSITRLQELLRLKYAAGGVGVKYVMGHAFLDAKAERGSIEYDHDNSFAYLVDGEISVRTAGFGFTGPWNSDHALFADGSNIAVAGHGFGFDLGGILYNEHSSLSLNVSDMGVLYWRNGKSVNYQIKGAVTAQNIIEGIDEAEDDAGMLIFDEYPDDGDTLEDIGGFSTLLPAAVNIGYSYQWDFAAIGNQKLRYLADYAFAAIHYRQSLVKTPGRSFVPRFSLGGEAGALRGYLPVRLGYVFGGAEKIASAAGIGFDFRYGSIDFSYKAVGHPFFVPKRGAELAAGISISWGLSVDQDKDSIPDNEDKCRTIPEDRDGFEDEDGCPDYDNDLDSVPDTLDKCINRPEDRDAFEDTDGCPDFDNDEDGVPDSLDQCPVAAEDRDDFKDDDGCPDTDNDGDNILDKVDKCPNTAEDIDGYEDNDGCPDYDNDSDGVPDTLDECLNIPETLNGYKDTDGCPDTLIKPSDADTKKLSTKLRAINFKTGSAEMLSGSFAALNFIADFLKNYETLRYEIQGHTDSQGSDNYNLLLSAARAGTVRTYLLSKGIPEERLIGIGYGEAQPVASNKTARGRAMNRRVAFRIIETNDEYSELKIREAEFREKVRAAKIKGVR